MIQRALLIAVAAIGIGGCKWFKSPSKDNVAPPAELVEFPQSLAVSELWSRDVGDGAGRSGARLRPSFGDGRVYVSDVTGTVSAFDLDSGSILWQADLAQAAGSGPGFGEGLVAVGTLEGTVVALDASSGEQRWQARVSSEVIAAPAIEAGVVVVRVNDGRMFGLNAADGERRWVFDRGVPLLTLRGNGAPIVRGGTVYAGYDNGKIVALALDDGSLKWEQSVAQVEGRTELERMIDIDGAIADDGATLFAVSHRGQIAALDTAGGRVLWAREFSAYGGVALAGKHAYATDTSAQIWAFDTDSGASVWQQQGLLNRFASTPVIVGDYLVVGDFEGYVHWYRAETGDLLARRRVGDEGIQAQPLVVGDIVIVASAEGQVAAFRAGAESAASGSADANAEG
jgi:outer membrane protein assembly factor BamB